MTFEEIKSELSFVAPDYVVVRRDEYENESHQSFKFLYNELLSDRDSLLTKADQLSDLLRRYSSDGFLRKDVALSYEDPDKTIHVENIEKSISDHPGSYSGASPSWFTCLGKELNRDNVKDKNIRHTFPTIRDMTSFFSKKHSLEDFDKTRRNSVLEIIHSDCSNEEKYLRYLLISPGLDQENAEIVVKASDMNFNAGVVIALLEQSKENYNYEILRLYMSELRKGTEFKLKNELANELLSGTWKIKGKNKDGDSEYYVLAPERLVQGLEDAIRAFRDYLNRAQTGGAELSAIVAESSAGTDKEKMDDGGSAPDQADNPDSIDYSDSSEGGIDSPDVSEYMDVESDFTDSSFIDTSGFIE